MHSLTDLDTIRELDAVQTAARRLAAQRPVATTGATPTDDAIFLEATCSNVCENNVLMPSYAYEFIYENAPVPEEWASGLWLDDIQATIATIQTMLQRPPACTVDAWLAALRSTHGTVMGHRPQCNPGDWKRQRVVVGSGARWYDTVPIEHLDATLRDGYARITEEPDPWVRSIMVEYLIVRTHPFEDGNGRLSRIHANHHLTHRRILKTKEFDDYVRGIQQLRDHGDPLPWLDVVAQTQLESDFVNGKELAWLIRRWARANWITDRWDLMPEPTYSEAERRRFFDLPPSAHRLTVSWTQHDHG